MSKEEQEAIEQIKIILNDETIKYYYNEEAINSINIVLNYISRLQKELEQEKEKNKMLIDLIKQAQEDVKIWKGLYDKVKEENEDYTEALVEWVNGERINTLFCVSKDKIKDKIKELEEQCKTELLTTWLEAKIEVLEELLGE